MMGCSGRWVKEVGCLPDEQHMRIAAHQASRLKCLDGVYVTLQHFDVPPESLSNGYPRSALQPFAPACVAVAQDIESIIEHSRKRGISLRLIEKFHDFY